MQLVNEVADSRSRAHTALTLSKIFPQRIEKAKTTGKPAASPKPPSGWSRPVQPQCIAACWCPSRPHPQPHPQPHPRGRAVPLSSPPTPPPGGGRDRDAAAATLLFKSLSKADYSWSLHVTPELPGGLIAAAARSPPAGRRGGGAGRRGGAGGHTRAGGGCRGGFSDSLPRGAGGARGGGREPPVGACRRPWSAAALRRSRGWCRRAERPRRLPSGEQGCRAPCRRACGTTRGTPCTWRCWPARKAPSGATWARRRRKPTAGTRSGSPSTKTCSSTSRASRALGPPACTCWRVATARGWRLPRAAPPAAPRMLRWTSRYRRPAGSPAAGSGAGRGDGAGEEGREGGPRRSPPRCQRRARRCGAAAVGLLGPPPVAYPREDGGDRRRSPGPGWEVCAAAGALEEAVVAEKVARPAAFPSRLMTSFLPLSPLPLPVPAHLISVGYPESSISQTTHIDASTSAIQPHICDQTE